MPNDAIALGKTADPVKLTQNKTGLVMFKLEPVTYVECSIKTPFAYAYTIVDLLNVTDGNEAVAATLFSNSNHIP